MLYLYLQKGQFLNEENRIKSSHNILKSHLTKHMQDLYNFSTIYNDLRTLLLSETGHVFGRTIIFSITLWQNIVICHLKQKTHKSH